jgi:hypothetical protein
MVNLLDLKWLVRCQQQLRDMAEDPDFAGRIIQVLDEQPDLRKELPHIYVRALETLESSGKKLLQHSPEK